MAEARPPHWLVKVAGQAHGKGVLVTYDVDEAVREAERYIRSGAQSVTVHCYDRDKKISPR